MDLFTLAGDGKEEKVSENKETNNVETTTKGETISLDDSITIDVTIDDKKMDEEVSTEKKTDQVKPIETMDVQSPDKTSLEWNPNSSATEDSKANNKEMVEEKSSINNMVDIKSENKMNIGVKAPKRSPGSGDVGMEPPAKVSRLLESKVEKKEMPGLIIENIPGNYEETRKVIQQFIETEFGEDSALELCKEQTGEQTNILLIVNDIEDLDAVFEKIKDLKIDGKTLTVKKHYNKTKVVPVDLFDEEYQGTYGLSEDFLNELGIKPPLSKWIHISNTNCQRNILMELLEYAGKVLYCNVIHTKLPYAKVMFSHPLEAVQAISLYNKQTFYGRLLNVTMVQAPPEEGLIPKGVQKIGKGLGRDGTPLRDILRQFERYYKGEKFYIDYSVLESEKHRVPVRLKTVETPSIEKDKKDVKKVEIVAEKKEMKKEEKKEEKIEEKKAEKVPEKKEEKKEAPPKKCISVMTQTYALPSSLIQKMADVIKIGVSVTKISKALDRLADDHDDVVVIINDKDKNTSEKGKGKRPRSLSPIPAKSLPKPTIKPSIKPSINPIRPQKAISTRVTPKFNKPQFNTPSKPQPQNNNFSPNNNFNNQQQYNSGNRGNMGMMQNMGQQNMAMGQNMPMGQHNIGMGHQNIGMGQQNIIMGHQNMPIGQQNMSMGQNMPISHNISPMGQLNVPMGQHNNMGQNSMSPFNNLNQAVSMVHNAGSNIPMGQTENMGMGQGGTMGQGFQNNLGQGTAEFLVLVSNLPQSVTFKLLHEKMGTCGDVKFLKMTNPGCALVGYGELWEAQRCVAAFNKTVVDGHKVELRLM